MFKGKKKPLRVVSFNVKMYAAILERSFFSKLIPEILNRDLNLLPRATHDLSSEMSLAHRLAFQTISKHIYCLGR